MESEFNEIANSLFGKTNPFLCNWENLKLASRKGSVKTKFVFHTNHFKSLIKNKSNNVFFQGLITIKFLVGVIWLGYYLFSTKDFLFLLTLPVSFLFFFATEFFWHKRFLVTIISVTIIILLGRYLNLNSHYYYYLTFLVVISSIIHSVYDTFLTELFYYDENIFVAGIDGQYIAEIYDGIKNKSHKGPFFMHKVKF